MGRPIAKEVPHKAVPPGFHQELNTGMMEDLWITLASTHHPELTATSADPPSMDQLFDTYLKDVTWQEFWRAFPYELRELGNCLIELDALGLLLSAPVSRSRFERHFEQLAGSITSSSRSSSSIQSQGRAAGANGNNGRLPARNLAATGSRMQVHQEQQLEGLYAGALPGMLQPLGGMPAHLAWSATWNGALLHELQQQQHRQPVRRASRQQLQQRQLQPQHLAYISPVAPHGLLATTLAAAVEQPGGLQQQHLDHPFVEQQQQLQRQQEAVAPGLGLALPHESLLGPAAGLLAAATRQFEGSMAAASDVADTFLADWYEAGRAAARAAGTVALQLGSNEGLHYAGGPIPPAVAAAAPRLPNAAAAAAQAAQAAAWARPPVRLSGQRRSWQEACEPAGEPDQQQRQLGQQSTSTAAEGGTSTAAGSRVDNRRVWRAVHEWLTSEDEDLLLLVSQVVPFSLAGRRLRPEAETRQELQALASSRPVPPKVVRSISERLSQPCPSSDGQLVRVSASSGFSRRSATAVAALLCSDEHDMLPFYISLAGLCSQDEVEAAVMHGLFGCCAQVHEPAAAAAGDQVPGLEAVHAATDAAAEPGQAGNNEPLSPPPPQQQQQALEDSAAVPSNAASMQMGGTDPAAGADAAAAVTPTAAAAGPAALHVVGTAAAAATGEPGTGPEAAAASLPVDSTGDDADGRDVDGELLFTLSESEDDGMDDDGDGDDVAGCDCGEQLAAHLALLGHCLRRQRLLLLLDEVDAAMMPEDGRPLRELLRKLVQYLPQAVVLMSGSSDAEAWQDAPLMRQVGEPLVQQLYDSQLVVVSHRLPRSLLFMPCYHFC